MYLVCAMVVGGCFGSSVALGCGKSAIDPDVRPTHFNQFISGGIEAVPHSWPWQVELLYKDKPTVDSWGATCGGSIVTPYNILTAAHCLSNKDIGRKDPKNWKILIGAHNISKFSLDYKVADVAELEVHEDFHFHRNEDSYPVVKNDIAIITLTEPIEFGDNAIDVCLTDRDFNAGTECVVAGWGETEKLQPSDVLKQADLFLVPSVICKRRYPFQSSVDTICAFNKHTQEGACGGDSGGPLVCQDGRGFWYQQGIVSMGSCGERPGAYVRVPHFYKWIERKIRMSI